MPSGSVPIFITAIAASIEQGHRSIIPVSISRWLGGGHLIPWPKGRPVIYFKKMVGGEMFGAAI
jgi:hypothetical protein